MKSREFTDPDVDADDEDDEGDEQVLHSKHKKGKRRSADEYERIPVKHRKGKHGKNWATMAEQHEPAASHYGEVVPVVHAKHPVHQWSYAATATYGSTGEVEPVDDDMLYDVMPAPAQPSVQYQYPLPRVASSHSVAQQRHEVIEMDVADLFPGGEHQTDDEPSSESSDGDFSSDFGEISSEGEVSTELSPAAVKPAKPVKAKEAKKAKKDKKHKKEKKAKKHEDESRELVVGLSTPLITPTGVPQRYQKHREFVHDGDSQVTFDESLVEPILAGAGPAEAV